MTNDQKIARANFTLRGKLLTIIQKAVPPAGRYWFPERGPLFTAGWLKTSFETTGTLLAIDRKHLTILDTEYSDMEYQYVIGHLPTAHLARLAELLQA